MTPPPERPTKPISLADELDDLVDRVRRPDGGEADRREVWQMIALLALRRVEDGSS